MNNANCTLPTETNLQRMIEPLANYIAAANRPKAALNSALAVLLRIVEETNQLASASKCLCKESMVMRRIDDGASEHWSRARATCSTQRNGFHPSTSWRSSV